MKVSQYMGPNRWVQFLQGIQVRLDIKTNISFSVRPINTRFGKQVHLEELTQMRLIEQVLVV